MILIGADKYKYGKLIKYKKNDNERLIYNPNGKLDMGQIQQECESNDGIAFATVTDEKEKKKSEKKRGITCFRCKIAAHYLNECNEEPPNCLWPRNTLTC